MKTPQLAELEALALNSRERFEQLAARIGGTRSRPAAGPALREEYWRSLRELFPRARLVSVRGVGHWVHSEAPGVVTETLRRVLREEPG